MDMQQESDHRDSPGTDVGMLAGLANVENHECWNEFYRLYSKSILLTAAKAGLTQSEAEDVLQKTMMDVTKNIGTFTRRRAGSFRRWLTQLAAWRAADCVRRRDKCLENRAHTSGDSRDTTTLSRIADPAPGPDTISDREWMSSLYETALARVRKLVPPKQYQVYDLCVNGRWPARKVSKFLGINAALIYVFKYRVERRARKELARLLAEAEPYLNRPPND